VQVTIIGRHKEVPQDLRRYMEDKANKLPHYYDRVMAVEIIVDTDQVGSRVELIVSVAGHEDFVAEEKGADMFACFDICLGRAEKQLTRFKDKVRDQKHHTRTGETGA